MFMLIIWLQGIWLPLHGYSFSQTPLWAGIYMIPLTVGFLLAGPVSGILADRYGARPFATGGLLVVALSFVLLLALPVDFSYWGFAALIFLNSIGMGMFIAPQPGRHHEQPAGKPTRGGRRHGRHLQFVGPGAVYRYLFHADDPGPGRHAALGPLPRPDRARRRSDHGSPGLPPAPRGEPLCLIPGLQPDSNPPRPRRPLPPSPRPRPTT